MSSLLEVIIEPSCHIVVPMGTVTVNVRDVFNIYYTGVEQMDEFRQWHEIIVPSFGKEMPRLPTVVMKDITHGAKRSTMDMKVLFFRKTLDAKPKMVGRVHPIWELAFKQSEQNQKILAKADWKLLKQVMCAHSVDASLFLGDITRVVHPKSSWATLIDAAAELASDLVTMYKTAVPVGVCMFRQRLVSQELKTLGRFCAGCKTMCMEKPRQCPCRKGFYYCGKDCQKKHWATHKTECEWVQ